MFRGGRGSARDVVVRRCGGVGYGAGDGDAGIATATQDAPLSGLGGGEESPSRRCRADIPRTRTQCQFWNAFEAYDLFLFQINRHKF